MVKLSLNIIITFVSLFHTSHQVAIDYNGPTIGEQVGEIIREVAENVAKMFVVTQNDEFVNYSEESYFYKLLSKLNSVFEDTTENVIESSIREDTADIIEILESDESDSSSEEDNPVIAPGYIVKPTSPIFSIPSSPEIPPYEIIPPSQITPPRRPMLIPVNPENLPSTSEEYSTEILDLLGLGIPNDSSSSDSSDSDSVEYVEYITPDGNIIRRRIVPNPSVPFPAPNPDFPYINGYPDVYYNYQVIPVNQK